MFSCCLSVFFLSFSLMFCITKHLAVGIYFFIIYILLCTFSLRLHVFNSIKKTHLIHFLFKNLSSALSSTVFFWNFFRPMLTHINLPSISSIGAYISCLYLLRCILGNFLSPISAFNYSCCCDFQ